MELTLEWKILPTLEWEIQQILEWEILQILEWTDPGIGNTTNTTDSMDNGKQNNSTDVDMRSNIDIGMRNNTNNVTGMDMDSGGTVL